MDEVPLAEMLTATLLDLVALPSPYPPGDTCEICAYAARRLEGAGYAVEVLSRTAGVDNVVARLGAAPPSLVFNAHADTVGPGDAGNWHADPFQGVLRKGAVTGLGAGNCKGSMAAQIWLAEEVARRGGPRTGELVFTFVGDEERLGPDGLCFLRETRKVAPDMLVLGGQTENQLIVEERGVMWARITAHGKAAHAGNPTAGDNAIMRMVRLLDALGRDLAPRLAARRAGAKQSTLNVGIIRGGHNTNVVPASCVVDLDRRLLPDEKVDAALAELEAVAGAAGEPEGSYEVEFLTGTNGFSAPTGGPCVSAFRAAIERRSGAPTRLLEATGVSDGRYFADDGIEILNFGPGAGAEGHAANESVPVSELVDAAIIQLDVVDALLGVGK